MVASQKGLNENDAPDNLPFSKMVVPEAQKSASATSKRAGLVASLESSHQVRSRLQTGIKTQNDHQDATQSSPTSSLTEGRSRHKPQIPTRIIRSPGLVIRRLTSGLSDPPEAHQARESPAAGATTTANDSTHNRSQDTIREPTPSTPTQEPNPSTHPPNTASTPNSSPNRQSQTLCGG
jgi:hypothetical protein